MQKVNRMNLQAKERSRAQESRAAIERMYIIMRHLFIRGNYKPLGVSGESLIRALLTLKPEIYGTITDPDRAELEGLVYVMDRLPKGIEECRQINLISREGLEDAGFEVIIPLKRRRNCYRVDEDQMYIEVTRGRSDIYDILTHLTFLYIESEKIKKHALGPKNQKTLAWKKLEEYVNKGEFKDEASKKRAYAYLATILGRTFSEAESACTKFEVSSFRNNLFHVIYWLGKQAIEEFENQLDREITFSSMLRERVGHHLYGESWANNLKRFIYENKLMDRPLHIISANMHSVMNVLYGYSVLKSKKFQKIQPIAEYLSNLENSAKQEKVRSYANKHGLYEIPDESGTNITVQIIDTAHVTTEDLSPEVEFSPEVLIKDKPVILVMDYAFGEQAFEAMDELLKPYDLKYERIRLNISSISIMGKAGILEGQKGDLMIPTAYVFEGTTDNYPIENEFNKNNFAGYGLNVYEGPMITVLGTSLQNKDVLRYFLKSSWKAIGLEMEGAHYQKAIQSALKIRHNLASSVKLRYAYYASDNPLITGKTLASGSLGVEGVKPTYLITRLILNKILGSE